MGRLLAGVSQTFSISSQTRRALTAQPSFLNDSPSPHPSPAGRGRIVRRSLVRRMIRAVQGLNARNAFRGNPTQPSPKRGGIVVRCFETTAMESAERSTATRPSANGQILSWGERIQARVGVPLAQIISLIRSLRAFLCNNRFKTNRLTPVISIVIKAER
jgi:hypothetical protein